MSQGTGEKAVWANPRLEAQRMRILVALACAVSLMYGDTLAYAEQNQSEQAPSAAEEEPAPAAPLGKLDYTIEGAMIGGFALVAVPAEYRVTDVMTFIVSYDGVVYQGSGSRLA
jgi:hypothetical protein